MYLIYETFRGVFMKNLVVKEPTESPAVVTVSGFRLGRQNGGGRASGREGWAASVMLLHSGLNNRIPG